MTLDVLITTAGGYPYPRQCIDSLQSKGEIPEGVRILVRDNPSSKKDHTYDYLVTQARKHGPEKFLLFSPDWPGEHGHNLDFLTSKSSADWCLAIDSDLEFISPNWLCKLKLFIEKYPHLQCAVEMAATNKNPNDQADLPHKGKVPRLWTPRATSWFMLYRPSFVREQGVSFGRNDYEVAPRFREVYPYSPPKFMRDSECQRWTFENGWQLLWAGLYANGIKEYSCVQIPPEIRGTYVHHDHKICTFMFSAGDKPNTPQNRERWGEDIPQFVP